MTQENNDKVYNAIEIKVEENQHINVKSVFTDYVPKKENFLKIRIRFLGWEVDVELLEAFSGSAVWIVFSDLVDLNITKEVNKIYDTLFVLLPIYSWIVIAGVIGFSHLVSILIDKSWESDFNPKKKYSLEPIKARMFFMRLAFIFNLCITLSVFMATSYALVWKFMALFSFSAFWTFIRLKHQCDKLTRGEPIKKKGK